MSSKTLIIISLIFISNLLLAQERESSNLRNQVFELGEQKFKLDSLYILPSTIKIFHQDSLVDKKFFTLQKGAISFNEIGWQKYQSKELKASYRVHFLNFNRSYSNKVIDLNEIGKNAIPIEYDLTPDQNSNYDKIFESDGLVYDGSFSRGFTLGNSQSLVLNSSFNMQLSGDLGNDLKISAAISDENLPIQPEGNTQLLQEFDKVFIRIDRRQMSIIAGDYELRRPDSYFINYYKRLQGLQVLNANEIKEGLTLKYAGNYAISKGKFARNNFEGEEGNQGPYKLRSSEGERIIKVLAGTEKVFVDGVLLTRGLEQDYIISYDRSELRFTDNFLITKDKRIIVEFEFADQNYVRSQYGTQMSLNSEKFKVNFNFYNEQDNKNTTGDIDLDSLDLAILREAGDSFNFAFKDGTQLIQNPEEFERALYIKVFEPSISDSILVYTPDNTLATHIANFTELGPGNGSYEIDLSISANGRAYRWVGAGNGSFDPVIKLTPPERKSMMSIGSEYSISKNTQIAAELAMSHFDLNRFSNINNEDNAGYGIHATLSHRIPFGDAESKKALVFNAKSEIINQDFEPLNPYRIPEFTRDWNFTEAVDEQEVLNSLSATYQNGNKTKLSYTLNSYDISENYTGIKHGLDYAFNDFGLNIFGKTSQLNSEGFDINSSFFRPNIGIEKSFSKKYNFKIGASFDGETNEIRAINNNELSNRSAKYAYIKSYISATPSKDIFLKVGFNNRKDWLPELNQFSQVTEADEIELVSKVKLAKHSNLDGNFTIRDLEVTNNNLTTENDQLSYLGRLDYALRLFNGGLRSNTSYQIGSGQEPKLEFEFVQVQSGEGQYIWLDDGDQIQEINEFQIAPVQDTANFVRVSIINNEFIRTDANSLNHNFRLDFKNILKTKTSKAADFVKKFSLLSNLRIDHRAEDQGSGKSSFFRFSSGDSSLVSFLSAQNHTIFFNKGNPTYDIQFGLRNNQNKIVQITGFEFSKNLERFARVRWNYHKGLDLIVNLSGGRRSQDSEFFEQNEFDFSINKIRPEIIYRPTNNLRFIAKYAFDTRSNDPEIIAATAKSNEFGLETNLRKSSSLNLNTNFSFVKINYDGPKNGVLQLSMLEGLQDGNNFLWGVNMTKRLSNNLDMIISYDGRKTGLARTIHTARAQVRATF